MKTLWHFYLHLFENMIQYKKVINMARNRRNKRSSIKKITKTISPKQFLTVITILITISLMCFTIIAFRNRQEESILAMQREELNKTISAIYEETERNITQSKQTARDTIIRISAVGDILCGNEMISDGYDEATNTYSFLHMFQNTTSILEKSDLVLGTMETNFTEEEYSGYGKRNAPKEFAQAVKNSGINFVTISHNHSLDYGIEGLKTTKKYLQELGYHTVGDTLEKQSVIIQEIRGAKIAFLSYTYGVENESSKSKEELKAINIYCDELAKNDLEYAKEKADFCIVLMHWGDPYATEPNNDQKRIAKFLVENGANVILGNHPAAIQTMEILQTKEGENAFVAYSLGNYISSIMNEVSKVELVLNIELRKSQKDGTVVISKVDYTPLYVLDNGTNAENRYELIDMKGVAKAYANGNKEIISKQTYKKLIDGLSLLKKVISTEKEQ